MSRYQDQVFDEYARPVSGAEIWVYTPPGVLVGGLTDDGGAALANPVTTDTDGMFYFNVADGQYELEIRYAGKLEYRQLISIGSIAVPNGSITTDKLADNSVTPDKLANVLTGTVCYRKSSGAGDPEWRPLAELKADLGNGDWHVTGNVIGTNLVGTLIVARPASGASEGGQMVFGYVGKSDMVGGVNGCWTVDVSNFNDFRIFRVSEAGAVLVPLTIAEITGEAVFGAAVHVPVDPYGPGWNGNATVPTKDAIYDKIEALVAAGGSGTSVDAFEYTYSATYTEPPATNQVRVNNAAAASVTKIWVSNATINGLDPSLYFAAIEAGDDIIIQRKNDATAHRRYNVTGAVVQKSGYQEIPVAFLSQGATALPGGQAHMVAIVQQEATMMAAIPNTGNPTVNAILAVLRANRLIMP